MYHQFWKCLYIILQKLILLFPGDMKNVIKYIFSSVVIPDLHTLTISPTLKTLVAFKLYSMIFHPILNFVL